MSDVNKIYDREKSGKSLYNLIRIHKYIQFNLTFILFSLSLISLIWESQNMTKRTKKVLCFSTSIETIIDTVKTVKKR